MTNILPGHSRLIVAGAAAAGTPDPVVTFGGSYATGANGTVYESSAIAIGAATGVRSVFVGIRTTNTVTGVKVGGVGGVALTKIFDDASNTGATFWAGLVATGTTATIYVTCSSADRMVIGVWHGQNVGDPLAPVDTASFPNGTNSQTIDTVDGGFILAVGITYSSSGTITFSDITTDFNEEIGENSQRAHGGSLDELSAATGRTLAFTISGGANWQAAAVSMR